jgi:alpha-beta hydrolase superfamily lysophospholipase
VTDSDWTRISAIGQAAAAAISMLALVGLYFQIRMTRKSADLQALQDFVRNADQREDRLLDAETDSKRDQAFNEFLNFLETSAGALNNNLFPKTTKQFVREKVRDSIATIQAVQIWHAKFEQAITTDTTFAEIARFMRRYRADIDRVVKMRAALATADTRELSPPSQGEG